MFQQSHYSDFNPIDSEIKPGVNSHCQFHIVQLTSPIFAVKLEHMSEKWIRASDIPAYVYCSRAWWLQRARQVKPQNVQQLQQGNQYHQRHGRTVWQARLLKRTAVAVLFIVLALFAFQILSA